jgi:hypothetical protein
MLEIGPHLEETFSAVNPVNENPILVIRFSTIISVNLRFVRELKSDGHATFLSSPLALKSYLSVIISDAAA